MLQISANLKEINQISDKIIQLLKQGKLNVVTFSGDLGAGKTALIKDLLQNFNIPNTEITSPTFNLLNIYDKPDSDDLIWHYDLYRLKSSDEILDLDFEQALEQYLTLIEWPNIINNYLPKNRIEVTIKISEERRIYDVVTIINNQIHENN
jgi:tRNA threonylcarbamoyladenosine biosynthesis protein TsaE